MKREVAAKDYEKTKKREANDLFLLISPKILLNNMVSLSFMICQVLKDLG